MTSGNMARVSAMSGSGLGWNMKLGVSTAAVEATVDGYHALQCLHTWEPAVMENLANM
jgi:hypothetical protein